MSKYEVFSYILVFLSVSYLYLVVKLVWWSWAMGFPTQMLFGVYAVVTHQMAFVVAAAAYTWVCYQDFRRWRNGKT